MSEHISIRRVSETHWMAKCLALISDIRHPKHGLVEILNFKAGNTLETKILARSASITDLMKKTNIEEFNIYVAITEHHGDAHCPCFEHT